MEQTNSSNGQRPENGVSFEQSFGRLQEVVKTLSDGSLTLQEALSAFEEGMALAERCTRLLDQAELRIKQVSARAARAGSDALGELNEAIRQAPLKDEAEPAPPRPQGTTPAASPAQGGTQAPRGVPPSDSLAYGTLPWERGGQVATTQPSARTAAGQPVEDNYKEDLDLDPLFDEDD